MRIVLNILETLKPRTGIGHYTARLFDALAHELPAESLHAFPTGRLAATVRRWQKSAGGSPASRSGWLRPLTLIKSGLKGTAKRTARAALGSVFRAACRSGGFDLYHEPNFIPFDCDVPTVITVHDLSVLLHPEWHPADRVRLYERHFQNGLSRAAHIITDTHFLRDQVHEHLGVARNRVTAVPLGVGPEYGSATSDQVAALRRRWELPESYLLFVGTIEPRKNLAMLLRSYCDLPGALRDTCPLVLAGSWGWKSDDVADLYRGGARAKGVRRLGYIADDELPALYAGARALVYPSLYEGFGLPPLEMLASGGAVIASTADVHREVLGRAAHFLDPNDRTGWRNAMSRAITDDAWLAHIRRGGTARSAHFTWERCAAGTVAVYDSLGGQSLRLAA
jgi:glycosyltransferase involved in cell wall biosynthesis